MPRKTVIGVMGPGAPSQLELGNARRLGELIAQNGWVLLTGGRAAGVMDAASEAAQKAGGMVVGVLPGTDESDASEFLDILIVTDMGSARNNINVLSSDVVIACGMGAGTASEVALAIKAGKSIVLLNDHEASKQFFSDLKPRRLQIADSPEHAIELARDMLDKRPSKKNVQ